MVSVKKAPFPSENENIAVLCRKNASLASIGLNAAEMDYIKKEFEKKDRKVAFVNQLRRMVAIIPVEAGGKEATRLESCRRAGDVVALALNDHRRDSVVVVDLINDGAAALALAEGMVLGSYQFTKYHTKDTAKRKNTLSAVFVHSKKILPADVDRLNTVMEAVEMVRDLVNEPPNGLSAVDLSKAFQKMGKEAGFKVTVYDMPKITSLAMGGLLAVNKGSVDPPTFSILEYKHPRAKNKKPVVLVGKGVVYDTGGLSLKSTANSMDTMKCDMSGAAVIAGAMYAVAKARLPLHIIGLAPATDNRPGERAFAPGDIITMYDKQTVEMLNSDAEGRMILADALAWAKQYKPELVIDVATLTGAAAAAIGPQGIVAMGTAGEPVKNKLKASGDRVHERIAEFPFWPEFDEMMRSEIADMNNVGGRYGGAITAGKFLARFIDYPWLHLDIAGPAFLPTREPYRPKGGTGSGVRLLFDFFRKYKG